MSPAETACISASVLPSEGVLREPQTPAVEETLPPYLRLLYRESVNGLQRLHRPSPTDWFPTEWSQGYPPKEGPVDFELPFEEYERGENPWSLVGRRMVLDWGGLDKDDITITKKGELRRNITVVVAEVDFSDDRKPSVRVKLGNNLRDSLRNLNDIFGAMVSAHKKVVGDLEGREDSSSRNKLYALQVVNPRIGFTQAA